MKQNPQILTNNNNNNNVLILRDSLHNLFDANARGIHYWRKHKHHRCNKCHKYGHIEKDCDNICPKCLNLHNRSVCVFSLEKLYKKILGLIEKATIPDLEVLTQDIEKTVLTIQKENIQSLKKKEYKNLIEVQELQIKILPAFFNTKPQALESWQCIGQNPNMIFTKDNIETMFKNYGKGSPMKSFSMNFKQIEFIPFKNLEKKGEVILTTGPVFMRQRVKIDKKTNKSKLASLLDSIEPPKYEMKMVQTQNKHGVNRRFYTNQEYLQAKLQTLNDLIQQIKKRRTQFQQQVRDLKTYTNLDKDLKQLTQQVNKNLKMLNSIRRNRETLIQRCKQKAAKSVARRESRLNYQKNKLKAKWAQFKDVKDAFYTKKDDFYSKKNALYNKFKINKQELKQRIYDNARVTKEKIFDALDHIDEKHPGIKRSLIYRLGKPGKMSKK